MDPRAPQSRAAVSGGLPARQVRDGDECDLAIDGSARGSPRRGLWTARNGIWRRRAARWLAACASRSPTPRPSPRTPSRRCAIRRASWIPATSTLPARFWPQVLAGHCAARDPRLSCSLEPIRYDVAGIDHARFASLVDLTSDARANLFADYYTERIVPELHAEAPDAVGISLTNHQQWLPGLYLARTLKERGFFVVLGRCADLEVRRRPGGAAGVLRGLRRLRGGVRGGNRPARSPRAARPGRRFDLVPNLVFLDRGSCASPPPGSRT